MNNLNYYKIMLFLLFLFSISVQAENATLLIKPEPGEFRKKMETLEDEIDAYELLEKNKKNTEIQKNTCVRKKMEFIAPPAKKKIHSTKPMDNKLNCLKNAKKILFMNKELIEC